MGSVACVRYFSVFYQESTSKTNPNYHRNPPSFTPIPIPIPFPPPPVPTRIQRSYTLKFKSEHFLPKEKNIWVERGDDGGGKGKDIIMFYSLMIFRKCLLLFLYLPPPIYPLPSSLIPRLTPAPKPPSNPNITHPLLPSLPPSLPSAYTPSTSEGMICSGGWGMTIRGLTRCHIRRDRGKKRRGGRVVLDFGFYGSGWIEQN